MNVLDAFVHDPLMEWIQRGRYERHKSSLHRQNFITTLADQRSISSHAIGPIQEKLEGKFKPCKSNEEPRHMSVINHVEALINEATDDRNLVSSISPLVRIQTC